MHTVRALPGGALGAALAALSACSAAASNGRPVAIELGIPRSALPGPGLCRIWLDDVPAESQPLPQSCDGIEHTAPLGVRILERPAEGTRVVWVWYMSTSERGVIDGIDEFSIDTRRLIRVIKRKEGA